MPKWVKVTVVVVGAGALILAVAGYVGAKILTNAAADFDAAMKEIDEEGRRIGRTGTLEGCVDATVALFDSCDGFTCPPKVASFAWACLESAPYEQSFCNEVPVSDDEDAIKAWGEETCAEHGRPDDAICAATLAVVPQFCETRR